MISNLFGIFLNLFKAFINSWNLTNNKLHQLFKDNKEFISIKVRGNTWEPITRWLRLDSRIFRETTSKARITLCDIESLA